MLDARECVAFSGAKESWAKRRPFYFVLDPYVFVLLLNGIYCTTAIWLFKKTVVNLRHE